MPRGEQIAKPAEGDTHVAGFSFLGLRPVHREKTTTASVLITGTSTGIGFAVALAFGRAGHKLSATMRSPSRAPELARIT